jgi:EmrB/QacA subfamily drug resistance transporter
VVNAYTLAFASLLVVGGRLADRIGRHQCFLVGVAMFATASCAIGLSSTYGWIVGWRAIQGAAAALTMPTMLPIISSVFAPNERGRAIGIWAGFASIGLMLGPVVGGLAVQTVGWRAIFFLNLPVAATAIAVTLPAKSERGRLAAERRFELPGFLALAITLGATTVALTEGNTWGWGSSREIVLYAASALGMIAFVFIELRGQAPIVDVHLLRSRAFLGANLVGFSLLIPMASMFLFLALFMQNIEGYSPLKAGLCFFPATAAAAAAGLLAGRLVDAVGPRAPIVGGLVVVAVSLLWLSRSVLNPSFPSLSGGFALMGMGSGFVASPTSTAAMNAVDQSRGGVASGLLSTSRMIGAAFGIAAMGALIQGLGRAKLYSLLPGAAHPRLEAAAESLGTRDGWSLLSPAAIQASRESFVLGLRVALLVGTAILLGTALSARFLIPNSPPMAPTRRDD